MKYIKLINNSEEIDFPFREAYLSRLGFLEKKLNYFDKKEIEATITFLARVEDGELCTSLDIQCDDEVFKKVIEDAINKFHS